MEQIISNKNNHIKDLKKLDQPKYQRQTGSYLIEGWHLVKDAIRAKADIKEILVIEKYREDNTLTHAADRVIEITDSVAQTLSHTKTPQGVFAVVAMPSDQKIPTSLNGQWLLLDQIQDPGNMGTLIRTADAAGYRGVVVGNGSVDPFSPKTVRSMQGSQFHIPIYYQQNLSQWSQAFQAQDIAIFGSELNQNAVDYKEIQPLTDFGIIIGNEGNGISPDLLKQTTQNIYIPILGAAESLNAAVAGGILMFSLKLNA